MFVLKSSTLRTRIEKSLRVLKLSPRLSGVSGRRGSNPRPSAWKADALPTELLPQFAPFSKGMQRYNFLRYALQIVDDFLGFLGRNR